MAAREIAPKDFERQRQNLVRRIGRRASGTFSEEPDPELYAMLDISMNNRRSLMPRLQRHLRRMIASEFVLITNTQDNPDYAIAWRAVREEIAREEIWALEKTQDFDGLPSASKAAISDVLALQRKVILD